MGPDFIDDIRQFYEAHRQELYTYALSITGCAASAEDALHNAFSRVLRKGKAPRDLRPYMFKCVRHAALDERRAAARRAQVGSIFQTAEAAHAANNGLTGQEVDTLLRGLSADERECIVLKIFGGLTFKEIARTRGVSLHTAASWYRRGLGKLKVRLEERRS